MDEWHVVVADDESVEGGKDFDGVGVVGVPHAANELAFADGLAAFAFERKESAGFGAHPSSLAEVARSRMLTVAVFDSANFRRLVGIHAEA